MVDVPLNEKGEKKKRFKIPLNEIREISARKCRQQSQYTNSMKLDNNKS